MNRKFFLSMLILLTLSGYIHATPGVSSHSINTTVAAWNAAPIVKITSPKAGDKFKYGRMIYVDAEASDPNAAIEVVDFYFEGYRVGSDSTAPYSTGFFGYPLTPTGILKAVATNSSGVKIADSITIAVAYNDPPTIHIKNPTSGSVIKANDAVTIEVEAADTDGNIVAVYFWVDNNYVGASYTPPYQFEWKATEGAVNIGVSAMDNDYAQTTDQLELIVGKADFSVKINNPKNGQVFLNGDHVTIKADVVSPQSIDGVEFFVNDQSVAVDNTPPFDASFTAETGVSKILVVASSGLKAAADSIFIKTNDPNQNQLPFVRILDSRNGGIAQVGSNIAISTSESDPDGKVTEVEFFVNGLSIGVDHDSPFSIVWKAVEGLAEITAIPTDNTGAKGKESNTLRIQVTSGDYSLKIIAPDDSSVYKTGNTVKIEAFNNCLESYVTYKRSRVQFWANDKNLGIVMEYPYTVNWIAEKGKTVIKAITRDNFDIVIDSITIFVEDGNQNIPPVVKLKRPWNGVTIDPGKPLSIEANASDADGTIKSVSFFANATLIGTDNTAPYTVNWVTVNGATIIKAVAVDDQGVATTDSCKINVVTNTAPVIEITNPSDGDVFQVYQGTYIEAKASDAESHLSMVEFYENDELLGTSLKEPFKQYWSSSTPGKSVLKVIATDDKGLTSSDSVTVVVEAPIDSISVKIKSPLHFASYGIGDIVKLEAEASAVAPGEVDYVTFRINDSIEFQDNTAPYTATWTATDQGVVGLTVFARYRNHLDMDTDSIFVRESDFDVQIINPTEDSDDVPTGNPFTIEALASDGKNNKIEKVEFFVEGTSIGTDFTEPYSVVWPGQGQPGRILIVAVATNGLGEQVSDTVFVNVTPQNILVKIINPLNGQTFFAGDQLAIDADVSLYNVVEYHICQVEFFVNDVSIGYESKSDAFNPFHAEWVAKKGYAIIKAVAWTWSGISVDSIVIKVNDTVTNNPPTVSLLSPLDGAIYKVNDSVSLEADAFDTDGFVKKVIFYVHDQAGGTVSFTDTLAPYSYGWVAAKEGQYTIDASATDDLGAVGNSATAKITVTPLTGVKPLDADKWISVYPIPAKDLLTVEATESATAQLLSVDGKMLLLQTPLQANQKQSLNVGNVAAGSYILKVYNAKYTSFKRVTISK